MLRKIEPEEIGLIPYWSGQGVDDDGMHQPVVEWGDPRTLYVNEDYQRSITVRGRSLIRRIAEGGWSWRKFKLPVVTATTVPDPAGGPPIEVLVIIDGQHTATAAVTRGLRLIPWLLVKTKGVEDQADAFVGQNSDGTRVTALQTHKALVAAKNPEALTIDQVCERAGVTLCLFQRHGASAWAANETIALNTIKTLINRRYAAGGGRVMKLLGRCGLAPISADHIKAVEQLLFGAEFKDAVTEDRIVEALSGAPGIRLLDDAAMFSARHRVSRWQGLVSVLFQAATKRRAS